MEITKYMKERISLRERFLALDRARFLDADLDKELTEFEKDLINKYQEMYNSRGFKVSGPAHAVWRGHIHSIYVIMGNSFYNKKNNLNEIIVSTCFKPLFYDMYHPGMLTHIEKADCLRRFNSFGIKKSLFINIMNSSTFYYEDRDFGAELDTDLSFRNLAIRYQDFFSKKFLDHYLFSIRKHFPKYDYVIYKFIGTNWSCLLNDFRLFNIVLSGGSNTKRHILSPLQNKLAKFIACIEDNTDATVSDSFHIDKDLTGKSTHSIIDFKSNKAEFINMLEKEKKYRLNEDRTILKKSFSPYFYLDKDHNDCITKISSMTYYDIDTAPEDQIITTDVDSRSRYTYFNQGCSPLEQFVNLSHYLNNAEKLQSERIQNVFSPKKKYYPSSSLLKLKTEEEYNRIKYFDLD